MRKRFVIAATTALVVIGVAVLVNALLQPKPGTVEWYKKRSQQLHADLFGGGIRWKLVAWYHRLTGTGLSKVTADELDKQWIELNDSLKKLEELGFLTRREYVFRNLPTSSDPERLLQREIQSWRRSIPNDRQVFCWVTTGWGNHFGRNGTFLWVVAPREYQPEWEGVVRKLDVP